MKNRRKEIADAAALLFCRKGYAGTKISDIAGEIGVSVGTIYHDFVGKKEILQYVFKCTADPAFAEKELVRPVDGRYFADWENETAHCFAVAERDFAARLGDGDYTFGELVSDAFDFLARYAPVCLFIEKNGFDFPALAERYSESRMRFFATMRSYFRQFSEHGELRPVENERLTVTLVVEMLTWWAMDMRYTAFRPEEAVSLAEAKRVCADNLTAAYRK